MPNRAERRAAEHAARKSAQAPNPTDQLPAAAPLPATPQHNTISEAQLAANRANAQLSTGPTSPEGLAKSSRNALKTGLTGSTVLLPTDDQDEYNRVLDVQFRTFEPATDEEHDLIQSIVDSGWRISRIKRMETGIYLRGHTEFANKFNDQPEFRRAQLIETETYLKYEKSMRNLQIQEARLYRRIEKDRAELARLQSIRKREERLAAEKPKSAPRSIESQPARANGFEFSTLPQTTSQAVGGGV